MRHLSLEIQSYRAYRDRAKLDVRPLTLIYGHNQAGKSTALRLLGVLADSLFAGKGALDTSSPALCRATFKELGWLGLDMSLTPQITLTGFAPDTPSIGLNVKFVRDDEGDPIVNTLKITKGESLKLDLIFDELLQRRGGIPAAKYSGTHKGGHWEGKLTFHNLLPEGLPQDIQAILDEETFKNSLTRFKRLQWLQANRLVDGETQVIRELRCCQPDGAGLAELLKGESKVLDKASLWLNQQNLADQIDIQRNDRLGDEFIIKHTGREALRLALAGEGLRSLLPILLCAAWAEEGGDYAPTMLAIEEPESHLHPTLQVALFDRLLETIKLGIPVILETHSVYMLRAMQVAVLEGRLSAEEIGLHWVGQSPKDGAAKIETITVENDAVLTNWLPYTFEKEQELAEKIVDLRWKKGRPA